MQIKERVKIIFDVSKNTTVVNSQASGRNLSIHHKAIEVSVKIKHCATLYGA